jgi:hypothetical protein
MLDSPDKMASGPRDAGFARQRLRSRAAAPLASLASAAAPQLPCAQLDISKSAASTSAPRCLRAKEGGIAGLAPALPRSRVARQRRGLEALIASFVTRGRQGRRVLSLSLGSDGERKPSKQSRRLGRGTRRAAARAPWCRPAARSRRLAAAQGPTALARRAPDGEVGAHPETVRDGARAAAAGERGSKKVGSGLEERKMETAAAPPRARCCTCVPSRSRSAAVWPAACL